MLKTILFPTDFSEVSFKALDAFENLQLAGAEKVILLHVVDQRNFHIMEGNGYANAKELEKQLEKHSMDYAKSELEKMAPKIKEQGFTVVPKVVMGIPVQEILKEQKEDEVSLIVLGSHGKSNLAEIFLGSVAEKVVRKCTKPVLVIKR
ncbi:MAG: universal stress protein [Desulfovermiculus sp.]